MAAKICALLNALFVIVGGGWRGDETVVKDGGFFLNEKSLGGPDMPIHYS